MVRLEDMAAVGAVFAIPVGATVASVVYGVTTLALGEVRDERRTFTIKTVVAPEALARIESIFVHNTTTGEVYRVYPDAVAEGSPEDEINITVKTFNDGAPGDIWNLIKDDTDAVLKKERRYLETGEALITIAVHVPMPARDYTITCEAGHIA